MINGGCARGRVLLPLLLAIGVLAHNAAQGIPVSFAEEKRPVIFLSAPLAGHLSPLVAHAVELAARGQPAVIVSSERARASVDRRIRNATGVRFLGTAACEAQEQRLEEVTLAASEVSVQDGTMLIVDWFYETWTCYYDGMLTALRDAQVQGRLAVVDSMTHAGFDVAATLGLKVVINNACGMFLLSPAALPIADDLPLPFNGFSLAGHTYWASLATRVIAPPVRLALRFLLMFNGQDVLNAQRAKRGFAPMSLWDFPRDKLILQNGGFAILYPRPLTPLVQTTGPMISRIDAAAELTPEEEAWIAARDDTRRVVYVSVGTLACLSERMADTLLDAFALLRDDFRVLWSLKRSCAKSPRFATLSPRDVRVQDWVTQVAVLRHPRTAVFLSHCGMHSVHESALLRKPLLCVPMFGEHQDSAIAAQDAGIARWSDKRKMTPAELAAHIRFLASSEQVRTHLARASDLLRLYGGAERAAEWILFAADHGVEKLTPPRAHYSWVQDYELDTGAVWVILALLAWFVARLVARCARKACCVLGRQRKPKTE
jgi:UDP:flavonoid glycosyltransferase YjiC (YdhE family)